MTLKPVVLIILAILSFGLSFYGLAMLIMNDSSSIIHIIATFLTGCAFVIQLIKSRKKE